jgi:hypothetical protein
VENCNSKVTEKREKKLLRCEYPIMKNNKKKYERMRE